MSNGGGAVEWESGFQACAGHKVPVWASDERERCGLDVTVAATPQISALHSTHVTFCLSRVGLCQFVWPRIGPPSRSSAHSPAALQPQPAAPLNTPHPHPQGYRSQQKTMSPIINNNLFFCWKSLTLWLFPSSWDTGARGGGLVGACDPAAVVTVDGLTDTAEEPPGLHLWWKIQLHRELMTSLS